MTDAAEQQIEYLENRIELCERTMRAQVKQITILGQCVRCGEMDHQDGIRINNMFFCWSCIPRKSDEPHKWVDDD